MLLAFNFFQLFYKIYDFIFWHFYLSTLFIADIIEAISSYFIFPVVWFTGHFPVLIPLINESFLIMFFFMRFIIFLLNMRYLLFLFPNLNPYIPPWFFIELATRPLIRFSEILFPKIFGFDASLFILFSVCESLCEFLLYTRFISPTL